MTGVVILHFESFNVYYIIVRLEALLFESFGNFKRRVCWNFKKPQNTLKKILIWFVKTLICPIEDVNNKLDLEGTKHGHN